jgi:hypothetical protein
MWARLLPWLVSILIFVLESWMNKRGASPERMRKVRAAKRQKAMRKK